MAIARKLYVYDPGRIELQAVTVRRTRNGKVAHLFLDYTNGVISGFPMSFCDMMDRLDKKWKDADPTLPLCNRCGRAFHKERKQWKGEP